MSIVRTAGGICKQSQIEKSAPAAIQACGPGYISRTLSFTHDTLRVTSCEFSSAPPFSAPRSSCSTAAPTIRTTAPRPAPAAPPLSPALPPQAAAAPRAQPVRAKAAPAYGFGWQWSHGAGGHRSNWRWRHGPHGFGRYWADRFRRYGSHGFGRHWPDWFWRYGPHGFGRHRSDGLGWHRSDRFGRHGRGRRGWVQRRQRRLGRCDCVLADQQHVYGRRDVPGSHHLRRGRRITGAQLDGRPFRYRELRSRIARYQQRPESLGNLEHPRDCHITTGCTF